jgi:hypothetical protein
MGTRCRRVGKVYGFNLPWKNRRRYSNLRRNLLWFDLHTAIGSISEWKR